MPPLLQSLRRPISLFPHLVQRARRSPRLGLFAVALLTALMGIINLLSAVTPSLPDRRGWLQLVLPFYFRSGGRLFAALSGFLLLTLALNLLRRKRTAWWLTVGLLVVSIISHLVKGLDYEECYLAVVALIALAIMRPAFTAQSDRPSVAQGLRMVVAAMVFTVAYGTAGFYILDNHFYRHGQPTNFGLFRAISQTLALFFMSDNAGLEPIGRFAQFFATSIYLIGALTLAYAVWMCLRPVLLRKTASYGADRQRARALIADQGQTSLSRLSLLSDKAYYFSPSGQTVMAYVTKGRAALVLGDPMGPIADRSEAIAMFQAFCGRNDWFPAFYEVLPANLPLYDALGFDQVQIGEEAIVDLNTFHLKGKVNQNLRTAVNRLTKTGHRVNVFAPPISDDLLRQLRPISDEWLKHKNGAEKQFSMGWFDRDYLQDCYIGVVYDANGRMLAFANCMTGYNRSEVTVDLMRHRENVEKGMMDFLFIALFEHFKGLGLAGFSFSLSPLAGVGTSPDARRVEKGLNYFFEHLNQFYNFKGLHKFKEKYSPRWEPRYLVYPNLATLPDVAVGLVRADSGDRLLDYFKPDS
jgi:phosphatidylglycerol lysyltransferase